MSKNLIRLNGQTIQLLFLCSFGVSGMRCTARHLPPFEGKNRRQGIYCKQYADGRQRRFQKNRLRNINSRRRFGRVEKVA